MLIDQFTLDISKTFFMIAVVKHWNILDTEVTDNLFLETLKGF